MFTFKNVMNINLNYYLNMGCHLNPQNVENLSKLVSNPYASNYFKRTRLQTIAIKLNSPSLNDQIHHKKVSII